MQAAVVDDRNAPSAVLLAAEGGPLVLGVELNTVLGFLGLGAAGMGYTLVAFGFWRSGRF